MTQEELVAHLRHHGFQRHLTAAIRWRFALYREVGGKTLLALFRKRGIDLLETPLKRQDMVNSDGRLSLSIRAEGNRFAELAYTESDTSIHDRVLDVCYDFARGLPLPPVAFEKLGIGPLEWGRKYGELSKPGEGAIGEMKAIYYAASGEDGEDAYLSDGVWISPSGRLTDRS